MAVFWVVAPCSLAEVKRRFTGACCLHNQGNDRPDDGASKQQQQQQQLFFLKQTRCVFFEVRTEFLILFR
jgi:hypothetical protein